MTLSYLSYSSIVLYEVQHYVQVGGGRFNINTDLREVKCLGAGTVKNYIIPIPVQESSTIIRADTSFS